MSLCVCCVAGFAASNVSEMYDAKIFSIATLLSSYLLYNSVKVCKVNQLKPSSILPSSLDH